MAYSGGQGDRAGEMRFRNSQGSRDETPLLSYPTTLRQNGQGMASLGQSVDPRSSLQRRFTTESTKLNTMPPLGQPPSRGPMDPVDLSSSTFHKVQLLEKKRQEFEKLRSQRQRFEAEMAMIDLRQQQEEAEILQMTESLARVNHSAGYQSEPTTPPEYRDSGFPSMLSRPNRFSTSSMTSPPGLPNRSGRSGSQLTSPRTESNHGQSSSSSTMPSKSVPGSRRNSDEDEPGPISPPAMNMHRSTARNSMPSAGLKFAGSNDHQAPTPLGQINTAKFLFGEDDGDKPTGKVDPTSATSPKVKSYLQMNATDDNFPILVRHEEYPGMLSASSAALDLALSQSPGPESQSNGWPSFSRHRPQYSLPLNALSLQQNNPPAGITSPKNNQTQGSSVASESPSNAARFDKLSRDLDFRPFAENSQASSSTTTATGGPSDVTPPKLTGSYSTNDIPTMKNATGLGSASTVANSRAQQHFHNHNASLGRIPANAVSNRHSREISVGEPNVAARDGPGQQSMGYQPIQSALQANAPAFGPPLASVGGQTSALGGINPQAVPTYPPPGYYGGYGGMGPMGNANANMDMNVPNMHGMGMSEQFFQPPYGYQMYGYGAGRGFANQARAMPQKRAPDGDSNRFANVQLESLRGEIYGLCKDQRGCRYLQKKLEDRDPENIQTIFAETNPHVVELMTDPFGNYLCQKLLEYSNDEQRTVLINNAAPSLVKIALNQHGTRALQKMIEFISTPEQIQTIIYSLKDRVVELIQDLNGNHVIQKCLNRLSSVDAQFIFDAVGHNCVVVGTHRHGCCVLQRCIDHASGNQKVNLIAQISRNAFPLVQDPFGNYVVQYILDLGEPAYTEPLIQSFHGHVPALSKQKFSSNVIEKCLRTADSPMKQLLIEEMLQSNELERMLRDSYANYVIQTAMDFADADTKARLIDNIRPILPAIRSTPYGRRIQGKIQAIDGRSGNSSGAITPNDVASPGQIPLGGRQLSATSTPHRRQSSGFSHAAAFGSPNPGFGGSPGYEVTPSNHSGVDNMMGAGVGGNAGMGNVNPNANPNTNSNTNPGAHQGVRFGGSLNNPPPFPNMNHNPGQASSAQQPFSSGAASPYGRGTQQQAGSGAGGGGSYYF